MSEEASTIPPVPLWMVTFSDTMGLLVCFFVMLIGFSAMEKEDRSRAPGMLSGYAGIAEKSRLGDDSLLPPYDLTGGQVHISGYSSIPDYDPLSYVSQGFETQVRASVVANAFKYQLTKQGFEIRILAGEIFERDRAEFTAGGKDVLAVIARACRNLPHQIRVKAYADDLFIPNEGAGSAEELAFLRAAAMCEQLRTNCNIPVNQLSTVMDFVKHSSLAVSDKGQVVVTVLRPEEKNSR